MTTRYQKQHGETSADSGTLMKLNRRALSEPLRVLTEAQWQCWQENGYVIVPDAVPPENLAAVVDLLWEFQEMDPHDPVTWQRRPLREIAMPELRHCGMVEIYNHQALWNNRQHPRVHGAFADLWGTEKLWVTIDRANLNVPGGPDSTFSGFIHWDIDTSQVPLPVNVQGVLTLTETTAEMGGFQCVPDLYRNFSEWVRTQPADRNPFQPDLTGFSIFRPELHAGDLIIWNSLLPHGIRPNRSDRPRFAQYIAMSPAQEDNEDLRQWRIRSWRDRIAPEGWAFAGDPRNWEQTRYKRAALTDLGEKLLGLRRW